MSYPKPLQDRPIFQVELFDMGHQQGLVVNLPSRKRKIVIVKYGASPSDIAAALRMLADWAEASPAPVGVD